MPIRAPARSSVDVTRSLIERIQTDVLPRSGYRLAKSDETLSSGLTRQLESDQRLLDPDAWSQVK
jgi:hypothetical protein